MGAGTSSQFERLLESGLQCEILTTRFAYTAVLKELAKCCIVYLEQHACRVKRTDERALAGSLPHGSWSTDVGASPRAVGTACWLAQVRAKGYIWRDTPETLELESRQYHVFMLDQEFGT